MVQGIEKQALKIFLGLVLIVAGGQNLQAQRPYRASDQQIHTLLTRIESRTNTFFSGLNDALDQMSMSDSTLGHEINDAVRGFEEATNILRERFRDQRSISADAGNVLGRANRIDSLLRGIKLTARVNANWREIRADLNQLARFYSINWRWFDQGYNPVRDSGSLTGTWRLDISRSDNIEQVVSLAVRSLPPDQQRRVRFQLIRRMEFPETIGIEQRGRNLTLASTLSRQISFVADGRKRTENPSSHRSIQVNALLNGDQLIVTSTGDRGNDYHVTFDPVDAGQRLRLTRRIYSERLAQPVSITGVYDRISDIAQLNLFSGKLENAVYHRPAQGTPIIPNNTQLFTFLDNELSTAELRPGDPFRLIVRSPAQYENAVIEGVVTAVERSVNPSGRAALTLEFERISLGEGSASDFHGYIESIRTLQGEDVFVDYEGSKPNDNSPTERSLKRTSIAEGVGEVIGVIPRGGKGAAIEAGSIFIQGRDELIVRKGSEVIIRAGSPVLRSR